MFYLYKKNQAVVVMNIDQTVLTIA